MGPTYRGERPPSRRRRLLSRIVLVRIKILPITRDIRAPENRRRFGGLQGNSFAQPLRASSLSSSCAPLHPNLWISLEGANERTNEKKSKPCEKLKSRAMGRANFHYVG